MVDILAMTGFRSVGQLIAFGVVLAVIAAVAYQTFTRSENTTETQMLAMIALSLAGGFLLVATALCKCGNSGVSSL